MHKGRPGLIGGNEKGGMTQITGLIHLPDTGSEWKRVGQQIIVVRVLHDLVMGYSRLPPSASQPVPGGNSKLFVYTDVCLLNVATGCFYPVKHRDITGRSFFKHQNMLIPFGQRVRAAVKDRKKTVPDKQLILRLQLATAPL